MRSLLAQEAAPDEANEASEASEVREVSEINGAMSSSWETRTDARTLTLAIPAPRGQIVDRNGYPLVQTKAGKRVAISFPLQEEMSDEEVLSYTKAKLERANSIFSKQWTLSDEKILNHYKNRRWLPIMVSSTLSQRQVKLGENMKEEGLHFYPVYRRYYPHKTLAGHILGYTGEQRKLPKGPIVTGDPMFEEIMGRSGLEKVYDRHLIGENGELNVLFDDNGKKISEELTRSPRPGHNLVTTLNVKFQRAAESALRNNSRSGAAVLIDARSGDILAMASHPCFDPNDFSDGLSQKEYQALLNDPKVPLVPRAYQGLYPPASTFKVVVALAALEQRVIDRWSRYACAPKFQIGNRTFHNWKKEHEGILDVVGAIRRSCNTWFYQVGINTGAEPITSMAVRLGFGKKAGLPIEGEQIGNIPSNFKYQKKHNRKMGRGDIANMSIGQGEVLTTPLQVARAMAAIGTGSYFPKLRIAAQVQDLNDVVLEHYAPSAGWRLEIDSSLLDIVRLGMVEVVSHPKGTGKSAAVQAAQLAGKTGTAQWDLKKRRNLAWFAGFAPARNARYAFAVVYEGRPGEKVSGGRKAAPIVQQIMSKVFAEAGVDGLANDSADSSAPFVIESDGVLPPPPSLPRAYQGMGEPLPSASQFPRIEEGQALPQPRAVDPNTRRRQKGSFFRRLFGR